MNLSAIDVALRVAAEFDRRDISYALGGALAFGYWAVPRGTLDVDINVFVDPEALGPVFEALEALEVAPFDKEAAASGSEESGLFVVRVAGVRVDLFTPSIPFSRHAEATRHRVVIEGQDVWVLAPEALCVFKLLFFRTKDLADLEQMLAVRRSRIDLAYVRSHLVDMMGPDDERVTKWDELVHAASTT